MVDLDVFSLELSVTEEGECSRYGMHEIDE